MNKEAFFIDRDGVINRMIPSKSEGFDSPKRQEDVRLVEGIVDVITWVNSRGISVIEITNQPDYAIGKMDMETLELIEKRVHNLLQQSGAMVDHIYKCLHHPRGIVPELTLECDCRKPKPGLLLQAARELNIDLNKSIFLGDNASDVEAGKNAGCKTIIFLHGEDTPEKVKKANMADPDYKVYAIKEVIPILEQIFS